MKVAKTMKMETTTNDARSTSSATTPTNTLSDENNNDNQAQSKEASDISQDFGDWPFCNSGIWNGFWIRIGRQGTIS